MLLLLYILFVLVKIKKWQNFVFLLDLCLLVHSLVHFVLSAEKADLTYLPRKWKQREDQRVPESFRRQETKHSKWLDWLLLVLLFILFPSYPSVPFFISLFSCRLSKKFAYAKNWLHLLLLSVHLEESICQKAVDSQVLRPSM